MRFSGHVPATGVEVRLPGLGPSVLPSSRPHPESRVLSLGQIPEYKRTKGRVPMELRAWVMPTLYQMRMGDKFRLSIFLEGKAGSSFKGII